MSKLKGLGTNFETLVPVGVDVDIVVSAPEHKIHKLALDAVKPKQDQPRQYFNQAELEKLAHSIKQQGILQPIIVTGNEQNSYTIIAGERRWRASKLAGAESIPAIIKNVNELEHLQLAVLENVQRADLSPLELASSIQKLHGEYQQSYEDIASSLGKAYTTIVNLVRLLQLPEVMQESLSNGTISEGHGRSLLALSKIPDLQTKLYLQILAKNLSVRQTEALASSYKNGKQNVVPKPAIKQSHKLSLNTVVIAKKIGAKKIELKPGKKGGKIVISYASDTDLAKIDQALSNL